MTAVHHQVVPKHIEPRLVMLRDPRTYDHDVAALDRLAHQIRDRNLRIYVQQGEIHLVSSNLHLAGPDPYGLLDELGLIVNRPLGIPAGDANDGLQ